MELKNPYWPEWLCWLVAIVLIGLFVSLIIMAVSGFKIPPYPWALK